MQSCMHADDMYMYSVQKESSAADSSPLIVILFSVSLSYLIHNCASEFLKLLQGLTTKGIDDVDDRGV